MKLTLAAAVGLGIRDAMVADSSVYVMGEDVALLGGIFGVTKGLHETFGESRVFDTPISEGGFLTAAVGSAMMGARPVVEVQLMDFIMVAMDSLANQAAKQAFVSNGQTSVPMVVRIPVGVGPNGAGAIQCQYLHSWFMHIPGLKVVMPTTPQDGYGLVRAAIEDPNPVIFLEDKRLYQIEGPVEPNERAARVSGARVAREGSDVTLVAAGSLVPTAVAAAQEAAPAGVEVEVIDIRCLTPLDEDAVLASVAKTGRLIVADPGYPVCSMASELIASVSKRGFDRLKAAPVAVTPPDAPFPWSRALVDEYLPSQSRLLRAIQQLAGTEPALAVSAGR